MENILLDASVFLEYFLKGAKLEKSRKYINELLENKNLGIISTMCILEVKYHIIRRLGHEKAEEAVFFIKNCKNLKICDLDDKIAEIAADIKIKYYNKDESPLSFADAIHVATAIQNKCRKLVTADSDFKGIKEIKAELY